jgi:hypothetical protein
MGLKGNCFDGHSNAETNRIAAEEIIKCFEPIRYSGAGRTEINTSRRGFYLQESGIEIRDI